MCCRIQRGWEFENLIARGLELARQNTYQGAWSIHQSTDTHIQGDGLQVSLELDTPTLATSNQAHKSVRDDQPNYNFPISCSFQSFPQRKRQVIVKQLKKQHQLLNTNQDFWRYAFSNCSFEFQISISTSPGLVIIKNEPFTMGARKRAASATRDVISTSGLDVSNACTNGAAPR